ncbi:hypothetical protein KFK09_012029 [Dendrobium nobile]|uniref:Exocyst subunit Exo70 family protein n=1 Tax=Dendrobium nobile TaxID=94219 RepID=A0A8T3BE57_DENNO|nr:hypothetical protein KFK09_012029 [Dendrobium nobile]
MAGETSPDGHDKVIAAAHHIVNSLAISPDAAEDMMRIFSGFDNRLSGIFPCSGAGHPDPSDESFLASTEKVLHRPDDSSIEFIWEDNSAVFLSAVEDAIFLSTSSSSADVRSRAEVLLQYAMSYLEDQFRHIMIRNAAQLDVRISDDYSTSVFLSDALDDLKEIADRMILSGYVKELCQVYCSVRREILDDYIYALGVVRLSIEDVRNMECGTLDDKMKKWANALRLILKEILVLERKLCDHVFAGAEELRDECFLESTRGCTVQLLNFANVVAICQPSLEKLFGIIEMYGALNDVKPELSFLFSGDSGKHILDEADGVLKNLQVIAVRTLSQFDNALQQNSRGKPLNCGGLHDVTNYVMNYVGLLVDYHNLLDSVLCESREVSSDNLKCTEEMSPFGHYLQNLLLDLDLVIVEDSKLYENEALQYVFLMNNILYIAKKVKDSAMRSLLGDQWVKKMQGQVRHYSMRYLRASWIKALSYLKGDELGGSTYNASNAVIKDKFRNFNLAFEEIYRTQTTWIIPDPQLREELRISISEKVIPAYRAFWGRYGSRLEGLRHAAKHVKYTPEDIENHLVNLFEGSQELPSHPRRW